MREDLTFLKNILTNLNAKRIMRTDRSLSMGGEDVADEREADCWDIQGAL